MQPHHYHGAKNKPDGAVANSHHLLRILFAGAVYKFSNAVPATMLVLGGAASKAGSRTQADWPRSGND
jgi:hypothetical protein